MQEIFSCRYCLLNNAGFRTDFRSDQFTSSCQVLAEIKDKKSHFNLVYQKFSYKVKQYYRQAKLHLIKIF